MPFGGVIGEALEIVLGLAAGCVQLGFAPLLYVVGKFHDWFMMKFLNRQYIYNMSWEDPRIDRRVLDIGAKDHIITIASAGCNALDYIIEGAAVTALDFNGCQIALTELKMVATQALPHDEFFRIFAESDIALLRSRYNSTLGPMLSEPSRKFWDKHVRRITSFMCVAQCCAARSTPAPTPPTPPLHTPPAPTHSPPLPAGTRAPQGGPRGGCSGWCSRCAGSGSSARAWPRA